VMSEQPTTVMLPANIDGTLDHIREYHRHDPHMVHAAALPIGVVMHTAESFPVEQWADHPFYREYWSAYGVRELIAAKVAEDERYVVMLGMTRTNEMPAYSSSDKKILERYIYHLTSAYRIVRHLGVVQATAQAGHALIEASERPMILIGTNKNIVTTNAPAKRILKSGSVIFEQAGKLMCRSNQGTAALDRGLLGLQVINTEVDAKIHQRRVAVRLIGGGKSGDVILCSLWSMKPSATMGVFGPSSVVLLTIASNPTGAVDSVFLGSMFDLTPAEAKVAVGLVEGHDLQRIAMVHHVSIETIRSQLKSIFVKTGTHRQSDLVALLLRATA
ncbi:MAG: helix-turn-helix transcriptional regulator, partial [Pseudomonadota bacterium]|nr:helix-turn-helix transcriptional regulator [Pseudomonadota bacterium]